MRFAQLKNGGGVLGRGLSRLTLKNFKSLGKGLTAFSGVRFRDRETCGRGGTLSGAKPGTIVGGPSAKWGSVG